MRLGVAFACAAVAVVILTAIFPVYYRSFVINSGAAPETATAYWAYTTSLSLLLVAVLGPVAGAAADLLGAKKRFLAMALWPLVFIPLLVMIFWMGV